jgi:dTDP-4-dehydrorhamnose reductase
LAASDFKKKGEDIMTVLVTGAYGQLGQDIIKTLKENNINCLGFSRYALDITDYKALERCFEKHKPDVVIHCAAYTNADKAELEKDLCMRVNVLGTENIAKLCKKYDCKLAFISSDYVFDGKSDKPYEVIDQPKPINYYGATKYEAELFIRKILEKYFIIRTSCLFGYFGDNFVKDIIKKSQSQIPYYVVDDQISSPTYTADLANLIAKMIKTDKYGTYHATNEGQCSRYELAKYIAEYINSQNYPKPIHSKHYTTLAKHPLYTVLSKSSLDLGEFKRLPEYRDSLRRFLKTLD